MRQNLILTMNLFVATITASLPAFANNDKVTTKATKPEISTLNSKTVSSRDKSKTRLDPAQLHRFRVAIAPAESALRTSYRLYHAGDLLGSEHAAQEAMRSSKAFAPVLYISAQNTIGRIRIRQGLYEDALKHLTENWVAGVDSRQDLDIALCYARLGNISLAKRFISDQVILKNGEVDAEDIPGTDDLKSLEARILLSRGLERYFTASGKQEALADLDAAGKFAPENGTIAYYIGRSLSYLGRDVEAVPYFERAVKYGKGKIIERAQRRLN